MSLDLAVQTYQNRSALQKDVLHVWPPGDDDKKQMFSHFYREFVASTWYDTAYRQLERAASGDLSKAIFRVDMTLHNLHYCELVQKLPAIRVKDEYRYIPDEKETPPKVGAVRIAWSHAVGNNVAISAVMKSDTKDVTSIDSKLCDAVNGWYTQPGGRALMNIAIGNLPMLENWTHRLPEYLLVVPQPWSFSAAWYTAYPIYRTPKEPLTFEYDLRSSIGDLLRMEEWNGSKWVSIPCDLSKLHHGSSGVLPAAQLWGMYTWMDPEELDSAYCQEEMSVYLDDMLTADLANPVEHGRTEQVPLESKKPAFVTFYFAENVQSTAERNFSNYTTNPHDPYAGYDPVTFVTFKQGTKDRYKNIPHKQLWMSQALHHFKTHPDEAGYGVISHALESRSMNAKVGLVMDTIKSSLLLTIGDSDPYAVPPKTSSNVDYKEESRTDKNAKYTIHVRMLVQRELIFKKKPGSEREYELTVS